ncbi:GerMN domain-containing protein [Ammoniphilus sp. CFH 90114]|uniref:GerMN domain-containing protein n=1 Tax=Ammoniphilus sp. CFH 90114 TaxID=2493665 RepID=UPI00100E5BF7|nr:GerMN domain-containing protein [Ammoniphilus sp. CFH 90114]RXT14934.1 hypothetical protein EIZ39_01620 [Ammoniphilus sp. CFH 90114]
MKLKIYGLFLMFVLLTIMTGCSEDSGPPEPQANEGEAVQQTESPTNEPKEEEKKLNFKIYFTDANVLELKEQELEVTWSESSSKYSLAFQLLASEVPQPDVSPWEGWQLLNDQFDNGILTVDVMSSNNPVGSSMERMMILSLLQTMFQFEEVTQVQLLLNGQKVETLSGHIDIEKPFSREDVADL